MLVPIGFKTVHMRMGPLFGLTGEVYDYYGDSVELLAHTDHLLCVSRPLSTPHL